MANKLSKRDKIWILLFTIANIALLCGVVACVYYK